MKKYYKSLEYGKYNKRHSRKLFKRNQECKKWKRQRSKAEQGIPKEKLKRIHEGFIHIDIPAKFTFLGNTSEVLRIINRVRRLLDSNEKTFINLEHVNKIDNGAITVLLSIMTEYKLKGVDFNGNFPADERARYLLLSSGFFEHLFSKVDSELFDENSKYAYGKENQIITKPGKKVIPTLAKRICESVSNTLGHTDQTSKGLYRTLIELMHNTNNHAMADKQGEELWWLTVHHDKIQRKVSFVFLDFGVGIFNSLRNKPRSSNLFGIYEKLMDRVLYGSDEKIMKLILEGELHKSVTNDAYRGKGLPGIYEVNLRKQIHNLHIITNNVFSNVCEDEYKLIDCDFNGTFVYWEINDESEVSTWAV